ncbi:MAG: HlyC/CorC family transporter [Gemmatimonadota bacterium]|nr:MAG: HlyC/CorC family transporter [Gemmatimonadota bacterium]
MMAWLLIALCLSQSAVFSGLNLAVFGISRLRLEAGATGGNRDAIQVLALRRDSNFLLTTILWGNVAANTLLALVADSVMTGVGAFLFSTVAITFLGEIMPQAYFSRNALRIAALLGPVIRFYQFVLYPVARPTARMLDRWLGPEGIQYIRERDFREIIRQHMTSEEADLDHLEGTGALNFLELDDEDAGLEGEPVDPASVISLPVNVDLPVFPSFERSVDDPFLRQVQASGEKWVILTDPEGTPHLVLDTDGFLRAALFAAGPCNPYDFCHRPLVVEDPTTPLGQVIHNLRVQPAHPEDDVIDRDVILVWGSVRRVITGADILGRLLRDIVTEDAPRAKRDPAA